MTTTEPAPAGKKKRGRPAAPELSDAEVRRRTRVLMFLHARAIAEGADFRQQIGAAQAEQRRAEQEAQRLRDAIAEIRRLLPQHADVVDTVVDSVANWQPQMGDRVRGLRLHDNDAEHIGEYAGRIGGITRIKLDAPADGRPHGFVVASTLRPAPASTES
ncbi:hypothetical protein [Amycolatopsis kentuckyensis]|uniref:hypothetical protein n=1 Tax=Amycolatopsis kentuckyensis TaxID=218823 RepID=UPI003567BF14